MIQKMILLICCGLWIHCNIDSLEITYPGLRNRLILYVESNLSHKSQYIDCSKFVQDAYAEIDIKVGRSSRDQSLQGKTISAQNANPGDIILFENKGRVNHSGLIHHRINDTLFFIHRSSSRGLVMDHLKMPYFKQRFSDIRAILKE